MLENLLPGWSGKLLVRERDPKTGVIAHERSYPREGYRSAILERGRAPPARVGVLATADPSGRVTVVGYYFR